MPVIFHDSDLERLCAIKGDVRERTSGELSLLSVGGTADKVPKLSQLLRLVAEGRAFSPEACADMLEILLDQRAMLDAEGRVEVGACETRALEGIGEKVALYKADRLCPA